MEELDACLELAKKIKRKDETILDLKSNVLAPKNQILSDMPRGSGTLSSPQEDYLIRLERLTDEKHTLQENLAITWFDAIAKLKEANVTGESAYEMLKYMFYCGYPWKVCAKKLKNKYPTEKWNLNKCFRVYGGILHKVESKTL